MSTAKQKKDAVKYEAELMASILEQQSARDLNDMIIEDAKPAIETSEVQ